MVDAGSALRAEAHAGTVKLTCRIRTKCDAKAAYRLLPDSLGVQGVFAGAKIIKLGLARRMASGLGKRNGQSSQNDSHFLVE